MAGSWIQGGALATLLMAAVATAALGACAIATAPSSGPAATPAHYRCEYGIEFTVRLVDDSAMLDAGPRGSDVLRRDAGAAPQRSVYRNPRMRAEFGLGASGREAILRYPLLPLVAHCVQD